MPNCKKFLSVLLILFFIGMHGQQATMTPLQILKKATEIYSSQEYINYSTTYNLYLDYKSKKVHDQYTGIVIKENNINYFKIKNTEFIIFKKHSVKVNHDQKAMIISDNTKQAQQSPMSLLGYLKGFNYKLINENSETYDVELIPASKISQIMLGKVILSIKKSDFSLAKQTIYYIENMESKDPSGKIVQSIPRLEIIYVKRNSSTAQDKLLLNQENYFSENNNKIVVVGRLSKYKLFKS